jgi:hypothetical protein
VERQGEQLVVSGQPTLSALLRRQDEAEQLDTVKRLIKVKPLFPGKPIPWDDMVELDRRFDLKELQQQCRDAGLSISGDKKMLAAKLIARRQRQREQQARNKFKKTQKQFGLTPVLDKKLT